MTLSNSPAEFFTALHASGLAGVTRDALSGANEQFADKVFVAAYHAARVVQSGACPPCPKSLPLSASKWMGMD